jgi:hypothetical protein
LQTITDELAAILKSKFQAAADGFRVRVEITGPPADLVTLYDFPYVFGDTAPGHDTGGNAYRIIDTPYPKHANQFLAGEISTDGTDWEAFSYHPAFDDLTSGGGGFNGLRGPSPLGYTVVTQKITTPDDHTTYWPYLTTPKTPEAKSVDTIILWQGQPLSGKYPASMALTVDGVFIGNFSPAVAGGEGWDASPIRGTRYDLGTVVTGTTWFMSFTLVSGSDSWLRLAQIQAFNTTAPGYFLGDEPAPVSLRAIRVSIDHSMQTDADAFEVELDNSDGSLNLSNPDSIALPGRRIRIFQWYGDPANEVQTFDGFIDKAAQHG